MLTHLRLRPALWVLGFLLVAQAASAQSLLAQFEPTVTRFTLDNGLTFIIAERRDAPVVSFFTLADVGSVDEPRGQTGVAHMFEHMAFKGSTSLGSRDIRAELAAIEAEETAYLRLRDARLRGASDDEIARLDADFVRLRDAAKELVEDAAFDQIITRSGGVGLNAFTSADQTGYLYSLPSNKMELWFALEADRFRFPVLREFYQERDVVMEERRLRTDSNPTGRLLEEFVTTAFKAHPYGQPVIGHMADLQSLSRTEAQAFYDEYYVASNLTIAIVGDVDAAEARRFAERYFGPLPLRPRPDPVRTTEPAQLGERRVTIVEQSQPFVFSGFHRPSSSHPDDPAFTVLSDILGTGRTSRLYRGLVETGTAVAAQTIGAFPGQKYPSLFVTLGVPASGVAPETLEDRMFEIIDEVVREGVTAEEVERARTRARVGLVSGLENNLNLAIALATAEVNDGDWRALFRRLDALDRVTPADVQRVAESTFRPANRTVATIRTAAAN